MKRISKILSMFIAITIVLSTITISIPVSAAETVIWEEDFEGVTSFASADGWQNCYVTNNSGNTSGTDAEKNYVKVEDGKIVFKRTQDFTLYGNCHAQNNIVNDNVPTTGMLVFEMDYTQDGLFEKSGSKIVSFKNEDGEELMCLSFGGFTPGIFDSTGLTGHYSNWTTHFGEFVSGDAYAAMANGQPIKIKVIFDFDLEQYEVSVAHNGKIYRDRNGAQAFPESLTSKKIGLITFFLSCDTASTEELKQTAVTSTFDNIRMYVPEVTTPAVANINISDNQTEVAVDLAPEITFSTPVTFDGVSDITLKRVSDNQAVALTPSLSQDGTVATLAHEGLDYNTQYVLTIPETLKSQSGATLGTAKTYTFKTPSEIMLWEEDFSVLPSMSNAGSYVPGTAISGGIWGYGWGDNWVTNNTAGTSGKDEEKNYYGIDQKLIFVRGQDDSLYGNLLVENTILSEDVPTTGVVVYEMDYTLDQLYDTAYAPVMQIKNEAGQEMFALNFGHKTVGVFDSTGINYSQHYSHCSDQFGEFVSGDDYEAMADGEPIHIKVVFDLDMGKYYATLTHNGVTYKDRNGVMDLPEGLTTKQIGRVRFWSDSDGSSDESVTSTYDNIKLYVPTPVVPVIESSTIQDGATEVNVIDIPEITFSVPMNPVSLSNIKLYKGSIGGTEVEITPVISDDYKTVALNYEGKLDLSTTYYISVPTSVKSEGNGYVRSNIVYDFTTVAEEPVVPVIVSSYVNDGDENIGLTETIKVLWNTQINFDTISNVKLYKNQVGGTEIPLTPSISSDSFATYFAHDPLEYDTTYVLSIPDDVRSATNGKFKGTTVSFKTIGRTEQHRNVLWFEDFDTRTGWTTMEASAGWSFWTWIEEVSYGKLDDHDNLGKNKAEWRNGGVLFTKIQNFVSSVPVLDENGNPTYNDQGNPVTKSQRDNIQLSIPLSGFTMPESGLVALEYDFRQSESFSYKYTPDIYIRNSAKQDLNLIGLNSGGYGFQDITDGGTSAVERKRANIAPKEDIVGKDVHMQILYDLDRRKYTIYYTIDGVRKMAAEGEQDMLEGISYDLARITLSCECVSRDANPVEIFYDNFAVIQYEYPEVESTSAPQDSTTVAVDDPITITFTEPMMESTLENITLSQGSTPVEITDIDLSADGKTVTLSHNGLANNAGHTLTIPETVLSADYLPITAQNITFTTVAADANPVVKETSVADGQINVSRTDAITVTFSKQMNLSSLSNVTLTGGGNTVPLSVTLSDNNKVATFTHSALNYQTEYTLNIPVTVKATDNTPIASAYSLKFTTVVAPTPPVIVNSSVTDGETGVHRVKTFIITFDKAMDTATFGNITLKQGDTNVTVIPEVSNGNKTVSLGHTRLEANKEYTLTIPTTVKSAIGLGMSSDVVFTFTTEEQKEGETLLYGYYFDSAPDGSTGVKASYTGDNWNASSMVAGESAYADDNKVEFKNGKMVITKRQRIEGDTTANRVQAKVTIPTTNLPTTGVVSVEYDINYASRFGSTWYTDTYVKTNNNVAVTKLLFSQDYYGFMDNTINGNINQTMNNISKSAPLVGKDLHIKLVYNLDDWTYTMFYTVEGTTYQSPLGVVALPASQSKIINQVQFDFINRYSDGDPVVITIDNLEVKKLTKPQVTENTSVVDGQTGVNTSEPIKVAFNSPMDTNYFKDIKVYEGTVASENVVSTTSVTGEDSSICYIYFDKGLKFSKQYVLDIPASVISDGLIPVTAKQIEFTTEAPQVGYSAQFMSVKNLSGAEMTDIAGLQYVKATVRFTNNMGNFANVPKLVIAVCNSEGKVKSISYCERLVLLGSNQDVTASFTSYKGFEEGDYLKAYVLDVTTGEYMSAPVTY